jgi:hypothetical protein
MVVRRLRDEQDPEGEAERDIHRASGRGREDEADPDWVHVRSQAPEHVHAHAKEYLSGLMK